MNNKNYTNIKTSKLLAEVSGVETEMWWHLHPESDTEFIENKDFISEEGVSHKFLRLLGMAYNFTDLLAVIDEIGKKKRKEGKNTHGYHGNMLLRAYISDGSVMNLENGEVEKFISELIK